MTGAPIDRVTAITDGLPVCRHCVQHVGWLASAGIWLHLDDGIRQCAPREAVGPVADPIPLDVHGIKRTALGAGNTYLYRSPRAGWIT